MDELVEGSVDGWRVEGGYAAGWVGWWLVAGWLWLVGGGW